MSYYFIVRIVISDKEEYQKYLDKAGEIFKKYKGEYLVMDDEPMVLEGSWEQARMVLIRFNRRKDFWDWYYSEDYQEILKYRLNGSRMQCNAGKGVGQLLIPFTLKPCINRHGMSVSQIIIVLQAILQFHLL